MAPNGIERGFSKKGEEDKTKKRKKRKNVRIETKSKCNKHTNRIELKAINICTKEYKSTKNILN